MPGTIRQPLGLGNLAMTEGTGGADITPKGSYQLMLPVRLAATDPELHELHGEDSRVVGYLHGQCLGGCRVVIGCPRCDDAVG